MAEISKDLHLAQVLLNNDELVGIPTETVYGLAANALNADAVVKIFEAKNRPSFDPLIVHIHSIGEVEKYAAAFPAAAKKLAENFWPGPLTLLLPKQTIIPDIVTSGLDTVGLRCPAHPLTQELLKSLTFPLAAPSANPFGYVSPTTAQHVVEQLGDKLKLILDGGACSVGLESIIVGFEGDEIFIHRLGGIAIEEIEKVVGKVKLNINSSSNPKAPGQLNSHYAPKKKLIIGNIPDLIRKHYSERVGILSFNSFYVGEHSYCLSPTGSLNEAARKIFSYLRLLDQSPIDLIIAELVPDEGLGKAINDRLKRAAA